MSLTKKEFSVVDRFINYNVDLLSAARSQQQILSYVASRTLRFHKYTERISAGDFQSGSRIPQHLLPWGLGFSLGSFYRSRKRLRNRGLLDWEGRGVVWYRLNLPGILGGFIRLAARLQDTQTVTMLAPLLDKTTKAYQEQEWTFDKIEFAERAVMAIEDNVSASLRASREQTKAEVEKAMKNWRNPNPSSKKKFNTRWIRPKMEEWAEEAELKFEDTWTGRESQSAQNFLKYCAEETRDPVEWLYQVCINWSDIRDRLAQQEYPNQRHISNVVSFSEYFNQRRQMDKILAEMLAEPRHDVTVISMDEMREKLRGK